LGVVLVVLRGVRGGGGVVHGLAVLAGGALLAGCGGSSASAPRAHASSTRGSTDAFAVRVCDGARQAAAKAFGSPLSERIVSPAAAHLKCVLTGHQVQVTIDSQAGPRAYTEFDTEASHQDQVFGNGGVHNQNQFPVQITVPGAQVAVWIPTQLMVVATDSTPANGGAAAYVTVAVSGRAALAKTALRVATAAAGATFAAHPDGPA
jgi:hypothetical protein